MRSASVIMGGALLAALATAAAPPEDHRRGLQAYQRGDVVGAMAALRPAARAGHAPSQTLLAFILDRADFAEEAAALYRQAAMQDDPQAHAGLANLYLTGRGLAKDENAALRHFSKAASLGHPASIELIADGWLQQRWGLNSHQDPAAALAAIQRAAAQGHLPSIDAMAQAHAEGRHGLAPDAAEAARWRERAIELRRARGGVAGGGTPR